MRVCIIGQFSFITTLRFMAGDVYTWYILSKARIILSFFSRAGLMCSMSNQRGSNMKMISLELREEMQAALDDNLGSLGYATRSDFIRDAILEKLQNEGIPLPGSAVAAPSRIGIGGKPTH